MSLADVQRVFDEVAREQLEDRLVSQSSNPTPRVNPDLVGPVRSRDDRRHLEAA